MKIQRTYTAKRRPNGTTAVLVDRTRLLDPRLDLQQHSPEGFDWGYGEGGPAQLALALLADHLGDDARALALYKHFKRRIVWKLPGAGWTLTSADIDEALEKIEAQTARERLSDVLGVAIRALCHACGKKHIFWAHDRDVALRYMDEARWVESLGADDEVRFTCPECRERGA